MKKLLVFFMFLLSLTGLAKGYLAVISKDGYANLRKEPTIKSEILKKVDNNYNIYELYPDKFDTSDEHEDWYFVQVEKQSGKGEYYSEVGYIHKSQLEKHQEIYIASSKDGYINVRSKANTTSEILTKLYNGERVKRYPEKTVGDWYYVYYGLEDESILETTEGYIHKSQLKKEKQ